MIWIYGFFSQLHVPGQKTNIWDVYCHVNNLIGNILRKNKKFEHEQFLEGARSRTFKFLEILMKGKLKALLCNQCVFPKKLFYVSSAFKNERQNRIFASDRFLFCRRSAGKAIKWTWRRKIVENQIGKQIKLSQRWKQW